MTLTVLDLFSGIGGFSLGLEATGGFTTEMFCECEPYARAVIARHWPGVPIHDDVRTLRCLPGDFDVLCGGFPCQDISLAGAGAGLQGARSGLWHEFKRLIGEARPRYAIIENVSALRSRGLDVVLGGLAALGYDAEWHCIPAAAVGAPHRRDRVWIVAYPGGEQHEGGGLAVCGQGATRLPEAHSDANGGGQPEQQERDGRPLGGLDGPQRDDAERLRDDVADPTRLQPGRQEQRAFGQRAGSSGEPVAAPRMADALRDGRDQGAEVSCWRQPILASRGQALGARDWWLVEPDVGRVAHGVPRRVDRLKCLGNAVVPQIPQAIGEAILMRELFE